MCKFGKILLFLFFLPAILFSQTIIGNKNIPVDKLTNAQVRNIYLGNKITWENGSLIHLADYSAEDDIREQFSEKFLDLSPRKVSMIWLKVSLSGKSVPPQIFRSKGDLLSFISSNDGAIGYVNSIENLPENIKILQIE